MLAASFPSAGAAGELERFQFNEPHMGTLVAITIFAEEEQAAAAAADAAFDRIQELDSIFSDYDAESELMQLVRRPAGSPVRVSEELFEVLRRAGEISSLTRGAFDATSGPLVRLWRESRREGKLPEPDAIREARQLTGYWNVRLDPECRTVTLATDGVELDLGGIAKGEAADEALRILRERGLPRALVAVAGDIAAGDPPPGAEGWRVGIASLGAGMHGRHRYRPPGREGEGEGGRRMTSVISLRNAGVSTSGDTEQFVEIDGLRYSHIVDPATGHGLAERISVTVLAPDGVTADALATAISVMGLKAGLELIDSLPAVEALIAIKTDGGTAIETSASFPQE